ncbi:cofilin [Coemansia sp. RSA 1822]|nr:cofilin [Coemansia sp. RSA 638]KAJ2119921.1 cofilin [Coemansia sp. RSA 720]KAJ2539765.1 cofilin [Coemansia sp. RSA 1853]KAJ2560851.1 cofilin [Coemansia sp. RSA 1822]
MSSGIEVDNLCFDVYNDVKTSKLKFVIYKISDDKKSVIVDSTSNEPAKDKDGNEVAAKDDLYEEFLSRLPKDEGRFAVYDFDYEIEGGKRNKLLFYAWAPDTAAIKSKMLYASTKQNIRQKLVGISSDVQATDEEELSHENVLNNLRSQFR